MYIGIYIYIKQTKKPQQYPKTGVYRSTKSKTVLSNHPSSSTAKYTNQASCIDKNMYYSGTAGKWSRFT